MSNDPQWTLENAPLTLTKADVDELVLRHGEDRALDELQRRVLHALRSVKLRRA